jgi:gliding motility-associated-like protein
VELTGAIADGVAVDSVKAHITDAAGHALANVSVTLTIVQGGDPLATANAKFSNGTQTITGVTDASGNVVIPGYTDIPITDITMGTVWISASIDVNPGPIFGSPAKVTFVAGPPVPVAPGAPTDPVTGGTSGTLLTITKDFAGAGGSDPDSVKAHITDKFGNQVGAGVPVTFTITTGGTLASGVAQLQTNVQTITLLTDASGNIEVAIFSPTAGTVSINASINGGSLIDGSAQTVTFVDKPDVTNPETKLIVIVYEALADGTSTTVVNAQVVNQNGVLLPGQDVTFSIDSGTATIVTAQPVTTGTGANAGVASIQITSKTPGYVLITATVGGQKITFGSPARVKFVPINIYVPPVFTPNGDGVNDVLKPILVGISTFHYFSVYNRWGNLIFTSQDPNAGWDGRFKGVAQPVETYLWIAEGIDIQGKKIVQKGMTTLVR